MVSDAFAGNLSSHPLNIHTHVSLSHIDKAYERFTKQWGLSDDPVLEGRDPTLPVGLRVSSIITSSH
jgi:hypothetical protein